MPYDMIIERDVMVPMRDGVKLACDVYRPASTGEAVARAFPVILERTPYGKGNTSRSEISASNQSTQNPARSGGVLCATRLCGSRSGLSRPLWLGRRLSQIPRRGHRWLRYLRLARATTLVNGRIGTMGLSYAAHTQVALASLNPPGLAAMSVDSGGFSTAYQSGLRQGGAFELKQATWACNDAFKMPECHGRTAASCGACRGRPATVEQDALEAGPLSPDGGTRVGGLSF